MYIYIYLLNICNKLYKPFAIIFNLSCNSFKIKIIIIVLFLYISSYFTKCFFPQKKRKYIKYFSFHLFTCTYICIYICQYYSSYSQRKSLLCICRGKFFFMVAKILPKEPFCIFQKKDVQL